MSVNYSSSLIWSLLAGLAASACCVGPLLLLLLGISGAWVSHLTALEPYRPVFIGMALLALLLAYVKIFRADSGQLCAEGKVCQNSETLRRYKRLFFLVLLVVIAFILSPYLIVFFYG